MCTAILLRRPGHSWPLLFAGNRDEMKDRPWRPPGRHWPERPSVVAGRDESAGGSWLGVNDHGLLATVLNRVGSLGPAAGKRSRGELVLMALDHADATSAAERLRQLSTGDYRTFNLLLADRDRAFWLRNLGAPESGEIEVFELPPGLSMLTAYDCNDRQSPRIAANLARFEKALPPDPDQDDWADWRALLGRRNPADPAAAMNVGLASGFETVSSSLIGLPAAADEAATPTQRPVWLFAPGRPDELPFTPVDLAA